MADDPKKPQDNPARAAILARRKYFVASALATMAVSSACDKAGSQPCLNIANPATPDAQVEPQPCLKVAEPAPTPCLEVAAPPPPDDAGSAVTPAASSAPVGPPRPTPPQVCLKVAAPPRDR